MRSGTARENAERIATSNEFTIPLNNEEAQIEFPKYSEKWLIETLAEDFSGGGDVDDDAYKRKRRNNNQNDNGMSR